MTAKRRQRSRAPADRVHPLAWHGAASPRAPFTPSCRAASASARPRRSPLCSRTAALGGCCAGRRSSPASIDSTSEEKIMATRPRTIGNPVARSPLLRKGGPHQRSRSGERQSERDELAAELEQWHRADRGQSGRLSGPSLDGFHIERPGRPALFSVDQGLPQGHQPGCGLLLFEEKQGVSQDLADRGIAPPSTRPATNSFQW